MCVFARLDSLTQAATVSLFIITFFVQGCAREDKQQCWSDPNQYYIDALSKRLTKNGITHSLHPKGSVPKEEEARVCYLPRFSPDVKKENREIDNYFREVAAVLRDSCEELAYVEWATKEKLPFEVVDTTSLDGKRAGRMFNLYSITPEDVALNRQKLLDHAPRNKRCVKK